MKADVIKTATFVVKGPPLDFGACLVNKPAKVVLRLTIINVARGARRYGSLSYYLLLTTYYLLLTYKYLLRRRYARRSATSFY